MMDVVGLARLPVTAPDGSPEARDGPGTGSRRADGVRDAYRLNGAR
jgi:hypothetical protein